MRLIAVVADTHVPRRVREVPEELLQDLERHEPFKIFHAGDLTDESVIDAFEFIAPTHTVKGNNDALDLPGEYAETFDDVTIAMRHRLQRRTLDRFVDRHDADIVVYGHTHAAKVDEENGVTLLNPGSPTVPRQGEPSYALISIQGEQFAIDLHTF